MSAFVLSDSHINAMVSFARSESRNGRFLYYYQNQWRAFDLFDNDQARRLALILLKENIRSVNTRYSEENDGLIEASYKFKRVAIVGHVQMFKLIDCYSYQACETDDYEQTEAYAVKEAMKNLAINTLQGYDDAIWGLEEDDLKEIEKVRRI